MTDIKPVIERLCKLLTGFGFSKISAEVVRKAKFDKETSVKPFWKLLAELFATKGLNWKLPDDTLKSVIEKLDSDGNLVEYVKQNFLELGYTKTAFFNLPAAQTLGSRELLVAFAWLLTKTDPLQQLIANCFDPENINWKYLQHFQALSVNAASKPSAAFSSVPSTKVDPDHTGLERLIWLLGRLRLTSRKLLQMHHEELLLLAKFHSMIRETIIIQNCSITKLHLQLLLKPELLDQYLQIVHQETSLIKLYIKWKEVEDNFWKWMVSVLDLNEQSDNALEEGGGGSLYVALCRAACVKQLAKLEQLNNPLQSNVILQNLPEVKIVPSQEVKPGLQLLSDACNKLQQSKDELARDLSERQENCRKTLHTLSETFPNVTCRRPLSRIDF